MSTPKELFTKKEMINMMEKSYLAGKIATDFVKKYKIEGVVTQEDKMKAVVAAMASTGIHEAILAPMGVSKDSQPAPKTPTLMEMINIMCAPDEHEIVFPRKPLRDEPVLPTGRLARCVCKPGCTKELPEPEFHFLDTKEEKKRWGL